MEQTVQYEAFLKLETGSHPGGIRQLLVTPDGKTLITSGEDKTIRVWDRETRKQTGMLLGQIGSGLDGKIQTIALSRSGKYLVALAWMTPPGTISDEERDTDVRVYELETGNLQAAFRCPGTFQDLDFSPDDKYLSIVGNPKQPEGEIRKGYVYIYDTQTILKSSNNCLQLSTRMCFTKAAWYLPMFVLFPKLKRKPRFINSSWQHGSHTHTMEDSAGIPMVRGN